VSATPHPSQEPGPAHGPYEILGAGKELSRIHKSWLGPENFTLPWPIPYVGAAAAGVALVFLIPLLAVFGLPGIWLYITAALLAVIAGWVVSRTSNADRPIWALAAGLWHELGAPRPTRARPESGQGRSSRLPFAQLLRGLWARAGRDGS